MTKTILASVALSILVSTSRGASLVQWDFSVSNAGGPSTGTETSVQATSGDANFNLSNSLVTRGPFAGSPGSAPAGTFWNDGWPQGGVDDSAYFQFYLKPLAGAQYDINGVTVTVQSEVGGGPAKWSLATFTNPGSIAANEPHGTTDDYLVSQTDYSDTLGHPKETYTFPISLTGLTGPVAFRLYASGNEANHGGVTFFDIAGEVTHPGSPTVPETLPSWAPALAILGLISARRFAR